MKILAIDQSSVKSGFSVFNDKALVSYSMFDLTKEKDLSVRFNGMCENLHTLIINSEVDHVVFEDVSLQTNASTLTTLARLQGAMIQSLLISNIPYTIYKPSSWRKILCFNQGRGVVRKELKIQALDYVKTKYNITTKEDIAESICIGTAFLIAHKQQ